MKYVRNAVSLPHRTSNAGTLPCRHEGLRASRAGSGTPRSLTPLACYQAPRHPQSWPGGSGQQGTSTAGQGHFRVCLHKPTEATAGVTRNRWQRPACRFSGASPSSGRLRAFPWGQGPPLHPGTPGPPPRMRGAEPPRTGKARRAAPPARRPATVADRRLRCSSPLSAAMKLSGAAGEKAWGARRPPHSPDGHPREAARAAAPRSSAPGGGSPLRQHFPSAAWPAVAATTPRSPPWCGLLRPNAGLRCSREGDTAGSKSGGYEVGVGPRCPHRHLEMKALLKLALPQA